MSWSIKYLKDNILEMFNQDQVDLAIAPLQSIFENQDFSRFHYQELERLINLHFDGEKSSKDFFNLVMTNDVEVLNKEHEFKVACKANIMAFLRSLHCNTDLLAHAIYYSLGLNLNETTVLTPRYLNLNKVIKKLKYVNGSEKLICELNKLTQHSDYVYLNSLVNHSKHRANITSRLTYGIANKGKKAYEFYFPSFEYEEENYEKRAVYSFLHSEYDRQSEQVIIIGNVLNSIIEHANKALKRK